MEQPPRESMREIAARIGARYRVTIDELKSATREHRVAHPRQHAMAEMRAAGFSTTQIGRFLGGRDHTTIVFGVRQYQDRTARQAA